jgi:beta-lactamase superfamily II metal-dependent hydrolase
LSENHAIDPSAPTIEVVVFRAADGDCILIRCFADEDTFNVLIDGGRASTPPRLKRFFDKLPVADRKIDLFVVTHIDADHIAGAIALAEDPLLSTMVQEIWFNGPRHLVDEGSTPLSSVQGNALIERIEQNRWAWNTHFGGKAVVRRTGAQCVRPDKTKQTSIHLLGPFPEALRELGKTWPVPDVEDDDDGEENGAIPMGDDHLDIEALAAEKYSPDRTVANGSSIAFVLRHGDKTVMISADSHAEYLSRAIDEDFEGCIDVDVASLPHHGSQNNMSPDLAHKIRAANWIVSTQGGNHRVKKPDGASLARVLRSGGAGTKRHLVFNSAHPEAKMWDDIDARAEFDYTVDYPDADADWIVVTLAD